MARSPPRAASPSARWNSCAAPACCPPRRCSARSGPATTQLGTLSVNGNLAFAPGSSFAVDVAANGQSGKLAVAGATSIAGGSVSVFAAPGALMRPRTTLHDPEFGGRRDRRLQRRSTPACRRPSCCRASATTPTTSISPCRSAASPRPRRRRPSMPSARRSMPRRPTPPATSPPSSARSRNCNAAQVRPILTSLSGQNYSGFSNSMVQGAQLFMNNFLSQAGGGNRGQRQAWRWPKPATSPATRPRPPSGAPGAARWAAWARSAPGPQHRRRHLQCRRLRRAASTARSPTISGPA